MNRPPFWPMNRSGSDLKWRRLNRSMPRAVSGGRFAATPIHVLEDLVVTYVDRDEEVADGDKSQPDVEPEVVDAEIVDDDQPGPDACLACGEIIAGEHDCQPAANPEPEVEAAHPDGWDVPPKTADADSDPEPFDWRAYANERDVKILDVLKALRDGWPSNSEWNRPNRSKDIDALAADDTMAPIVRAAIDDAKGA